MWRSSKSATQFKSRSFFTSRLRHLQNCVFVMCALDSTPLKDKVIEWAKVDLWQTRSIQVEQIRVLAKGCFLIVTGSATQQQKALMDGPYKINGRMVSAFPWDPKFFPEGTARGHIAKDCPAYKEEQDVEGNEISTRAPTAPASSQPAQTDLEAHIQGHSSDENDGFTRVPSKHPNGKSKIPITPLPVQTAPQGGKNAESDGDEDMGSEDELQSGSAKGTSEILKSASTTKLKSGEDSADDIPGSDDAQNEEPDSPQDDDVQFPGEALTVSTSSKAKKRQDLPDQRQHPRTQRIMMALVQIGHM
ncbi:hypothetical protein R1sor_012164 [Riccia sorocarpa]|uniref:DUF4283 domain-containing protein n=1 Tax=Riccia sorocarpa TaxID=122646 RepID=A0ABD3I303_9MARC